MTTIASLSERICLVNEFFQKGEKKPKIKSNIIKILFRFSWLEFRIGALKCFTAVYELQNTEYASSTNVTHKILQHDSNGQMPIFLVRSCIDLSFVFCVTIPKCPLPSICMDRCNTSIDLGFSFSKSFFAKRSGLSSNRFNVVKCHI